MTEIAEITKSVLGPSSAEVDDWEFDLKADKAPKYSPNSSQVAIAGHQEAQLASRARRLSSFGHSLQARLK